MSDTTSIPAKREAAAGGGDRLAELRARITAVARGRRRLRLLSGLSWVAVAVVIALAALFLVDWTFSPGRGVRGLLLCGAAVVVAVLIQRRIRPLLARSESEIDVALAVERRQGIDSDLVAALEFAEGRHATPSSAELRDAVIDYVADFSRSWQLPREEPDPGLRRRAAWLAAALCGIVVAAALRPDFAAAFLNRLLLGPAHYPTRTRIESLTVAGARVDLSPGAGAAMKRPLGRPVDFRAVIGGEPPRLVRLRLQSVATGDATEIELLPDIASPADAPSSGGGAARSLAPFGARLPKLAASVRAQLFAGDAWTDPVTVIAIEPPLVDLALAATPPAYAAGTGERPTAGARQVAVLEGSEVGLAIRCTNKKLSSATLLVDGTAHPLRPVGTGGGAAGVRSAAWELAAAGSPLARLGRTVAFEIRVVDEDGLGTDMPLVGTIRVRPDAPPRVTADVQTRLVLPTAAPRVAWRVADDHAVASVVVVAEALGASEAESPAGDGRRRSITIQASLPAAAGWVGRERLPVEGTVPVQLDPLGLRVGDQVRLTVRAVDYRGDAAGRGAESEPVVIDVTDERGILAALSEGDERSVGQLDAIIDRELVVGGGK